MMEQVVILLRGFETVSVIFTREADKNPGFNPGVSGRLTVSNRERQILAPVKSRSSNRDTTAEVITEVSERTGPLDFSVGKLNIALTFWTSLISGKTNRHIF